MQRLRSMLVMIPVVVSLSVVVLSLGIGLLSLTSRHETFQQTTTADYTVIGRSECSGTTSSLPTVSGRYDKAAVATDYGPCSEMGRDILLAGGSAVDAAITSTLCLGVASPQSSGLGGGLFMLVYLRNGTFESILADSAAPAASDYDMFFNHSHDAVLYGARAICVPGELAGLWFAHQKYGTLPWQRLLTPVINMAEQCFPLAWYTRYALKSLERNVGSDRWAILSEMYTKPDGSLMKEGDLIRAPSGLIQTLRSISEEGASTFYGGEVGQKLIQDIQEQGGIMTLEDLTSYIVTSKAPSELYLKDGQYRVLSTPVMSSGNLLLLTVNILDECDMASVNFSSYEGKLKMYHYFIEASMFALDIKEHIIGVDAAQVEKIVRDLSTRYYAQKICSMINDSYVTFTSTADYVIPDTDWLTHRERRATSVCHEESVDVNEGDTSHVSVYSEQGDAVSLTTTVGRYFGSVTFSSQTGLFFNNRMESFNFNGTAKSAWNTIRLAPGARVWSSNSPAVITGSDGTVKGVIGSSGGHRIVSTIAWVILRALYGKDSLADIIEEPRIYLRRNPPPAAPGTTVFYEKTFPKDILAGLQNMGHKMAPISLIAAAQAVVSGPNSAIYAHSDRRKHGYPAGY